MLDYTKTRAIDCTSHVEKKGQFSYLSWAWALDALRQHCPEAQWEPISNAQGVLLHEAGDGKTSLVMTRVFDGERSMPMWMPVLDHRNKPITAPNCFDVNTALMRCLTKNIGAYSGIGLHLYAGEDLPPSENGEPAKPGRKAMTKDEKDATHYKRKVCRVLDMCADAQNLKLEVEQFAAEAKELGLVDWLKAEYRNRKSALEFMSKEENEMASEFNNIVGEN